MGPSVTNFISQSITGEEYKVFSESSFNHRIEESLEHKKGKEINDRVNKPIVHSLTL